MSNGHLEVKGLKCSYGRKEVLHGIDFAVEQGSIISLLGHNGAGKTTALRSILGAIGLDSGEVYVDGRSLNGLSVRARTRSGIAYVEPRGVIAALTVRENIEIASGVLPRRLRRRKMLDEVLEKFPDVATRMDDQAGLLSGGQRQQLALCMSLATEPRYMLLDEPLLGLSPPLQVSLMRTVRDLAAKHQIGIVLVEQNVKLALGVSTWVYTLRDGEVASSMDAKRMLSETNLWEIL